MTKENNTLHVSELYKRFGRQQLLNDIDLVLEGGSFSLLSGENGTGKSTFLRILAGLEKPDRGLIDFGREPMHWKRARPILHTLVLYLHQHPYMFDGSIYYNLRLALPADMHEGLCRDKIAEAVEWAGLAAQSDTPAKKLSGGERQRVALARAWLRRPHILLLDEPTSNMDQASRRRTLTLLESLKDEGIALLAASHDPDHFSTLADRHLRLAESELTEIGSRPPHLPARPLLRAVGGRGVWP